MGGGGAPTHGKLIAILAIQKHGAVELLTTEEVPDDALVIPLASMGAPTVDLEKLPKGDEALHACKGKLPRIFIEGRSWYPWAFEKVGFERHTVISFGPRSVIERLFADIEKRIRQFWNGFIGTYTREGLQLWVEAFAGFRNWKKDSKGGLS